MWNNVAEVATVLDFFRLMVPVTLLRRGPDRIPYSPSLFVLAVCLCALTAAFGVGAVFGLVEIAIVFVSGVGLDERLIMAGVLGLQAWAIVVDGFILSVALGVSLVMGCLLAFSILLPQVALVTAIGGAPG